MSIIKGCTLTAVAINLCRKAYSVHVCSTKNSKSNMAITSLPQTMSGYSCARSLFGPFASASGQRYYPEHTYHAWQWSRSCPVKYTYASKIRYKTFHT